MVRVRRPADSPVIRNWPLLLVTAEVPVLLQAPLTLTVTPASGAPAAVSIWPARAVTPAGARSGGGSAPLGTAGGRGLPAMVTEPWVLLPPMVETVTLPPVPGGAATTRRVGDADRTSANREPIRTMSPARLVLKPDR